MFETAGALVAFSSAANAGITIPAGDWTVDIGGNVNAYYTHTTGTAATTNTVNTGLLPAALGIGAKTRQNDLDVAFQFTFFTGIDSTNNAVSGAGNHGYGTNAALGMNSLNIRQAFMTIGDASWGQIKLGRDLGVFESDAILSDMTLLGVGSGAAGTGNTTLGRIGYGYLYADWKSQIQYSTPNWNGFQVTVAMDSPWTGTSTTNSTDFVNANKDMGFEGKATYDFAANDVTGRAWIGGITQKIQGTADNYTNVNTTATGWDIGGKVAYQGAELVASYYSGEGIGITGFLLNAVQGTTGTKTKSDGYYVQGTYKLPGVGTKLGLSYGESNLDYTGGTYQQNSWIVGAYHPLTKSVNLVAEYNYAQVENTGSATTNAKTVSLGAIMFF